MTCIMCYTYKNIYSEFTGGRNQTNRRVEKIRFYLFCNQSNEDNSFYIFKKKISLQLMIPKGRSTTVF